MSKRLSPEAHVARLDAAAVHIEGARRLLRLAADQLSYVGSASIADRCLRNVGALDLRLSEIEQARAAATTPQTRERSPR